MFKNYSQKIIKYRTPYEMPTVEPYDIIGTMTVEKFENMISKRIKQLRKQGISDSQCFDYLKSVVEEYIVGLESALERKRLSQKSFFNDAFIRRASDRKDFTQLNMELDEEIEKTEEEIDLVKTLYEQCNPLYQGSLNLKSVKLNSKDDLAIEEEDN